MYFAKFNILENQKLHIISEQTAIEKQEEA